MKTLLLTLLLPIGILLGAELAQFLNVYGPLIIKL